jgi:GT2 family glycosyltransferase
VTPDPSDSPENPTKADTLISVVVVNLDGGEMLNESLESVFAQTWPNVEVILVDNASSDDSMEQAQARFGDRLVTIHNDRNNGFAKGNNQAFAVAEGEWVFLLNNDAVMEPTALEELMKFLDGDAARSNEDGGKIGMLACRVLRYGETNYFDSAGLLLYPDGVCRPRGWAEKDLGQFDRPDEVIAPHGCAAMLEKSMLDDLGGFDERFFAYLEDFDLGMRAQLCGWKCWYVPTAIVSHRKSALFGNYSKFKAYHVERNRIYCAVKLLPRFILFVSPLFTLNRYLMQFYAARTQAGLSADFMKEYSFFQLAWILTRAYCSAFSRLPSLIRDRHRLSKMRTLTTREWYDLISRFKLDAIELALKF